MSILMANKSLEKNLNFMNKKVLVIGGLGLIGKKILPELLKSSFEIICADLNSPCDEDIIELVQYERVDITSEVSLANLFNQLDKNLFAVVNLAYPKGKGYGTKLENVELANFNENINLHLGGYFAVMKASALFFSEKNIKGRVISASSIYGVVMPKFELYEDLNMTSPVEYTCIKHSIVALTKYFAKYYKTNGVSFNCISYGGILDKQNPIFINRYKAHCGLIGMLEESKQLSSPILYFLNDHSIAVNGHNLIMDDTFTL